MVRKNVKKVLVVISIFGLAVALLGTYGAARQVIKYGFLNADLGIGSNMCIFGAGLVAVCLAADIVIDLYCENKYNKIVSNKKVINLEEVKNIVE